MENTEFKTTDFGLASLLYAKKIPFVCLLPTDKPKQYLFVFEDTKDVLILANDFWHEKTTVEPISFMNAQRELKRRLYSDTYSRLPR